MHKLIKHVQKVIRHVKKVLIPKLYVYTFFQTFKKNSGYWILIELGLPSFPERTMDVLGHGYGQSSFEVDA